MRKLILITLIALLLLTSAVSAKSNDDVSIWDRIVNFFSGDITGYTIHEDTDKGKSAKKELEIEKQKEEIKDFIPELEKQYKNSELKALKAQMNPHFIFNALNSIQEYILLNQKNLASDYLGKFADLIRNYLHYSDTGLISIAEEVKNLNLYLELEKLRFEDDLSYTITLDNTINSDTSYIPTMIVQPYIENALKHGLLHKKTDRNLKITIAKVSDELVKCIVEDNGVGRKKSKEINKKNSSKHKSFALKATSERLELLNFGKDKKIGVVIEYVLNSNDEVEGTKVILTIPVTKNI
ncbi:MAG: histidine kinase [Bacteroidetes bacterium]|nr:histidine kinase [Bacteroidota bacterium]